MNILSIESSTKIFSLAVSRDEKILCARNVKLKKVLDSSIIPAIDGILKKSGVPLKNLDGFAIGLGPGSFTSLRVGLSTVKAMAMATQKPIVGISSLDILAENAPADYEGLVCSLGDARRNLVFAALYEKREKVMNRTSGYQLTTIDQVLSQISRPAYFIGDGIPLYQKEIKAANKKHRFAEEKDFTPKARHLARLAFPQFQKKEFEEPGKILPMYLYPEDCQVDRRAREFRKT